MIIQDPGHKYQLKILDGSYMSGDEDIILTFVKREGENYPGNVGHYPGTNIQEVLRALINRIRYLNAQDTDPRNIKVVMCLQQSIWLLEERAAERHNRKWNFEITGIELFSTCYKCGHIGCNGTCH